MARKPLNALQAILIRERLILCFQNRKSDWKKYNVRKLIEDIALSAANEGEARAYRENEDQEDEGGRFDAALPLKHSTVDNLLNRRSSALSDDNLLLIRNFLLAEGYLTAEALTLCGQHPDLRLAPQFGGIAHTDPRLQRYRRELEGEYFTRSELLWIAEPGRSKPFVSLRAGASDGKERQARAAPPLRGPAISAASDRYEGRLFLMPGEIVALIEMRTSGKTWDGTVYRVAAREDALELINALAEPRSFLRTKPSALEPARDLRDASERAFAWMRLRWKACRERDRNIIDSLRRAWAPVATTTTPVALTAKDAALIEAAKSDRGYEVIRLLAEGANINAQDARTGRTAAHWAAASGSLNCVYALACREADEVWVLGDVFPDIDRRGEIVARWRSARNWRNPLITDHEGCIASALAPLGTDGSHHNQVATAIWRHLMRSEAEFVEEHLQLPRSALLEIWKPSRIMLDAMQRYAAPLPTGYTDPKPD